MDSKSAYPNTTYPSQTYAQQAYPSTACNTTTTTTTTVQSTRIVAIRPYFDANYLTSVPGLLKIIQLVLMLIAFILAAAAWSSGYYYNCPFYVAGSGCQYGYDPYSMSSAGWAKFVTITGFIITLILLNLYLFHLIEKFYQVQWLFVEMAYCALWAVLLLIAGAVMIRNPPGYTDGARGACVFFCWAAMIAYGIDAFFKFKAWRNGEVAQGVSGTVTSSSSTPARPPPPYPMA